VSGRARTILALLGLLLAGCAADPASSAATPVSREVLTAIQRYYESNAAEENNACSALIMSGVTRSELVSEGEGQLVVDVTYSYANFANRSGRRCRGIGNRRFTLSNASGRFTVIDMTGERRLGPSWRLIDARLPAWRFS
jgi:hypothetical protein